MERKPLPIMLAVLALLLASGALWFVLTRPTPLKEPGPATGSNTAEAPTKEHLEDNGPYHEITGTYPNTTSLKASAGASADIAAVQSMKAFVQNEASSFKKENITPLTAQDIQVQGLGGDRKYTLDMDYVIHQSPLAVSYVYHLYADTMGAHPNASYATFVFNAKTGARLDIKDLFTPTTDYLGVLSTLSREKLPSLIKKVSGYDADPDMLSAGTSVTAENFQTFYLEGSDLVLVFPPYQVGPYALGTLEVRIPRKEFGNALKAEYR